MVGRSGDASFTKGTKGTKGTQGADVSGPGRESGAGSSTPAKGVVSRWSKERRGPGGWRPGPGSESRPPRSPRPEGRGTPLDWEPEEDDAFPTAYLKPGEADRVLSGHPWIYEGCILRWTREAADGETVQVKDHRRRFLGVGFHNGKSKIRVRVLSTEREELEEAFFERRLRQALEHRQRYLPGATSYRLVNAEGDRLSGLIVDRYEDVLVVQMSSWGMDQRKAMLVRVLQRLLQPRAIVERNDMGSRKFEGLPEACGVLSGTLLDEEQRALKVRVNGLPFEVDLQGGHKTGLYLDQQVNQELVAGLAKGARVLDAFCFLGGFGLAAARAGAREVVGVDQSAEAVAAASRLAATQGWGDRCRFVTANVFDWLRTESGSGDKEGGAVEEAVGKFDLIVLDPPSFTRNRAAVEDALRGYKEIHLRALKLLAPGGVLATFCCSHHVDATLFEGVVQQAAYDARKVLRRVAVYTQAPDHPVLPTVAETEYLKGFAYELLPA